MKYLLTLEFRYSDAPKDDYDYTCRGKMLTIGVFDSYEEACDKGNDALKTLESRFDRHRFPDGRLAPQDRLSSNGGCFGGRKNLVTDMAYLKTPFEFFLKITDLDCDSDLDNTIEEVTESSKRYIKYKKQIS